MNTLVTQGADRCGSQPVRSWEGAALGKYRMKRFYPESDGGPGRKAFYVVDRYADPLGDQRRTDCETMAAARKLARTWNAAPPLPAWDTIQSLSNTELLREFSCSLIEYSGQDDSPMNSLEAEILRRMDKCPTPS